MIISLIAAIDRNGVIGSDGDLPWNIPSDLKKFREITSNKPIIMGRKTWDSIGRPLPNRDNIVISKNKNLHLEGAILASSPEQAITFAKQKAKERDTDEIMIIGGGYIYNEFIVNSDRLYITEVDMEVEGDAFFPKIDSSKFKEISREEKSKGPEDEAYHSMVIYEKIL
mgnify:FL=1|jgi:dihydrofolate reductase